MRYTEKWEWAGYAIVSCGTIYLIAFHTDDMIALLKPWF